jgi:Protein of unknown function (DUF3667)
MPPIDPHVCPNCLTERSSTFCPECGQKDQPLRQNTLFFLSSAFNEYLGIDGRLWLTLRLLFLKPGRLTSEHVRGRRARYLAPLRLYLSATVLFFFLLSVLDPAGKLEQQLVGSLRDSTATVSTRQRDIREQLALMEQGVSSAELAARSTSQSLDSLMTAFRADSAANVLADSGLADFRNWISDASEAVQDSEQERLDRVEENQGAARTRLEWQLGVLDSYPADSTVRPADLNDAAALLFPDTGDTMGVDLNVLGGARGGSLSRLSQARTGTERRQALVDLARGAIGIVPIVMFFVLPVFALALKLIYIRRDWYYSEHLIFALHNHAVAFIVFSLMAVAIGLDASGTLWSGGEDAVWADTLVNILMLALVLYFFLAQKHFYGQGWIKTAIKSMIVFAIYIVVIGFMAIILLLILASLFG